MSIITSEDLEASPLADLHALASTLGIDGFRRLRKPDLADAILARQGGAAPERSTADGAPTRPERSRRRRGGRARDADPGDEGGSSEGRRAAAADTPGRRNATAEVPTRTVEGVVELLANGSGFVRPDGAKDSDSDVYISAAQARRCELVAGDRVGGPVRAPRRSERHPSLIRIDTINGVAADEAVRGTRIDDIEVDWPTDLLALGTGDPLLTQIARVAPFGAGARVVITGSPRSGKTLVLGKLAAALAAIDGYEVELVAHGVRPEELTDYRALGYFSGNGTTFAAPRDAQDAAVEQAVERGRRVAVRGGNAILLIDTLDGLSDVGARRALAAGRNLRGAGTLTVIATTSRPLGGETTSIVVTAAGKLDEAQSGTLRAELLAKPKPKRAPAKPRAARPARAKSAKAEEPTPEDPAA